MKLKAPRFWYPQFYDDVSPFPGNALAPLSYVFEAATALRRALARAYRPRVPLICVGNAVAGGTGKTPLCLALAEIFLAEGRRPVFVTHGYGGRGGAVRVDIARHGVADVGDEALLLAGCAPTFAGRDRAATVRLAEEHGNLLIMDDGFQNPHVAPWASILVADGEAGIGNGRVIPAGPLREPFDKALSRASMLVMYGTDRQNLSARARVPVLHARIEAGLPGNFPREGRFVAFAGIGRPQKFYDTARGLGLDLAATEDFPDHHPYTPGDIDMLRLRAEEQGARLLTTEKDAVRLPPDFLEEILVLPVRVGFAEADAESRLAALARPRCG